MGMTIMEHTAIMLAETGELLGPESTYALQRSKLRSEYTAIISAAAKVTVTDEDSAQEAVRYGRLLQNGKNETEKFFKEIKVQIDNIKKPILAAEKEDQSLLEVERIRLACELTVFREKVEAEQRERQRLADGQAAAKAKLEREELERQAREEQLALAVELDVAGDHEQADAVLDEVVVVDVPVQTTIVQAAAPTKLPGSTGRTNWKGAVSGWDGKMDDKAMNHPGWVNFRKLVDAVAAGKVSIKALLPNESWIGTQGRNDKQAFSLPGCELKRVTSTSFRG